ncbi:Condensin complex subunit 1 [Armadillidium vulgare]|nr:Condensin complex subunit 1 [Armadillidium vulgare]
MRLIGIEEMRMTAGYLIKNYNKKKRRVNNIITVKRSMFCQIKTQSKIGMNNKKARKIHASQHMFGLIQKDKQLESFIEKLCHRLQATHVPRQWRDISYCLSLLPYSDKGVQKLIENFSAYSDKLHEEEVYNLFMTISELGEKTIVEEFEARLEECHKKNVEDENVVSKARSAKGKAIKKGPKKQPKRSRVSEDSDFESEEENNDRADVQSQANHKVDRPRRSVNQTLKNVAENSSESEMETDEEASEESEEEERVIEENVIEQKQKGPIRKNTRMSRR